MKTINSAIENIFSGKLKHISRFGVVGVLNTIIDFLAFTICNGLIGINYISSQVAGYSFGVTNSFILNKKWTFHDKSSNKKTFRELIQFIVVNLISLGITLIAMNFLVKNLRLNIYLSKVIVTLIAQITNFAGYKLWVFS
ncbi:MAG: GtrA family protein [Clostridiaceae bacterium]|jgi:putative flippase GtrA|nr:GtrA family protein [Clostridiaceae bacterium]